LLPRLRATRPDVVLNYWLYPEGFSAVQAGRMLGVPVIVGSIGSDLRRIGDPFTRHFVGRTLREASGVITVSEELGQRALTFGVPPEKVGTILNGCDRSVFYPGSREQARRDVGYGNGGELILFVGSLLRTKGLAELLAAFKRLSLSKPDLRLGIIGDGPFAGEIRAFVERESLHDRVLILGYKPSSEVAVWMRAADLFCLPSYSEGCPNVVVEALACGLPIVATSVGGITELVGDSSGVLLPARDDRALEAAIEKALACSWNRSRIAKASGRTWEDVAADTYAICRQVVERERASSSG
jgi:glycosyltransferase involved in cell wall biosynthesis